MLSLTLLLSPLLAQEPEAVLLTQQASSYSSFGETVAVQGDWAFVGAPDDYRATNYEGSVIVYHRTAQGWVEHQQLISSQPATFDSFGHDLAIDGDVLAVGAPGPLGNQVGAVHVFRFNGQDWVEEQILSQSTGWGNDWFGWAVDVDGDRIAVGAMWARQSGSGSLDHPGAAYVYEFDGQSWNLQQSLQSSDQESYDQFGSAVAIQGDRLVIGARAEGDYGGGVNLYAIGAAYVFDYTGSTWTETQKLRAGDAEEQSYFGGAVDLDGDTILVGSFGRNGGISHGLGAAYFFERQGGGFVEVFETKGMMPGYTHKLGRNVALEGDFAIIASGGQDLLGNPQGAVHPYRRLQGVWEPEPLIQVQGLGVWDGFALDVDLDGSRAITGAYLENLGGQYSDGAGFIYDLTPRFHLIGAPLPVDSQEDAKFTVRHGTPQTPTFLAFSLAGLGSTPVPPLGVALDIAAAKQLGPTRVTNGAGETKWDLIVPPSAQGLVVWLQAVQQGQTTNVIRTEIL